MRPESSTLSGTVVPRKPFCDTMTSTERFVPFRTLRGVLTRLIWMSRPSVSRPTPTVKTGTWLARRPEQRFLDRGLLGVGAVGHHHEAGERQAREFVLRPLKRFAELGLRAVERQVAGGADAIGVRREAEDTHGVAARQRLHHRAVGREGRADELAPRLAVVIGDAHAARVVQQDAEEVLLRHGCPKNQDRPEQAEEDEADEAERAA